MMRLEGVTDHVRRRITFGSPRSGLSAGSGSVAKQSSAAPAMVLLLQRRGQRHLVDDGAARGVDQDRGRLHQPQLLGADQPARFGLRLASTTTTSLVRSSASSSTRGIGGSPARSASRRALYCSFAPQGAEQPRGLAADLAEADQADGLAAQLARLELRRAPQILPDRSCAPSRS